MSTFHGFFQELGHVFRADRFTKPAALEQRPRFYLLSHIHTDHLSGLLAKRTLEGPLYCTRITRDLLFRLEANLDKVNYNTGLKEDTKIILEYNDPVDIHDLGQHYRLTAIDANHCPGSCMFLIEVLHHGAVTKAILYTGDIRADSDRVRQLPSNPVLRPYIDGSRTLDCIYLDTAAALDRRRSLSKREAIEKTLALMREWPADAKFFINLWTPGYEEFAAAVYGEFNQQIHVDRFKWETFKISFNEKARNQMFTRDPQASRFHACERTWKCDEVWSEGRGCFQYPIDTQADMTNPKDTFKLKRNAGCGCKYGDVECEGQGCERPAADEGLVVYINPVEPIDRRGWETYVANMHVRFKEAKEGVQEWSRNLMLPLGRHSTLPELKAFVSLFKPLCLFPNTVYDDDRCQDYLYLPYLFKDCVAHFACQSILDRAKIYALQNAKRPDVKKLARLSLHNLEKAVPVHFAKGVSNCAMWNFAGPDDLEGEMRSILEVDRGEAVKDTGENVEINPKAPKEEVEIARGITKPTRTQADHSDRKRQIDPDEDEFLVAMKARAVSRRRAVEIGRREYSKIKNQQRNHSEMLRTRKQQFLDMKGRIGTADVETLVAHIYSATDSA